MGVIPRPLYCPGRVAAAYTNYPGLPSRWQRTQNGQPRQSKSPRRCSSAWPDRARERPKAGDRARGVSTRSRQNSEGCPRGLGRSLPGRINRNRVVLFEPPPFLFLPPPRRLQAEAAAATVGTRPSALPHRFTPEGQICWPKYSLQYTVYYAQNREFLPVDSARLEVCSFLFTSGSLSTTESQTKHFVL